MGQCHRRQKALSHGTCVNVGRAPSSTSSPCHQPQWLKLEELMTQHDPPVMLVTVAYRRSLVTPGICCGAGHENLPHVWLTVLPPSVRGGPKTSLLRQIIRQKLELVCVFSSAWLGQDFHRRGKVTRLSSSHCTSHLPLAPSQPRFCKCFL